MKIRVKNQFYRNDRLYPRKREETKFPFDWELDKIDQLPTAAIFVSGTDEEKAAFEKMMFERKDEVKRKKEMGRQSKQNETMASFVEAMQAMTGALTQPKPVVEDEAPAPRTRKRKE